LWPLKFSASALLKTTYFAALKSGKTVLLLVSILETKNIVQNYLEGLNEAQRQAVENIHGASLIIAGAGSGKTRVLTYRITHLLKNGVKPGSILALTFTNKAAKEMKNRISEMVGQNTARYLWMGTFHSIFARILRTESEILGYPSNFTIYDSADSKSLIKSIIKDFRYVVS